MPKHLENGHQSPGMTILGVARRCPKNDGTARMHGSQGNAARVPK